MFPTAQAPGPIREPGPESCRTSTRGDQPTIGSTCLCAQLIFACKEHSKAKEEGTTYSR